jgi:hypothetical protein
MAINAHRPSNSRRQTNRIGTGATNLSMWEWAYVGGDPTLGHMIFARYVIREVGSIIPISISNWTPGTDFSANGIRLWNGSAFISPTRVYALTANELRINFANSPGISVEIQANKVDFSVDTPYVNSPLYFEM